MSGIVIPVRTDQAPAERDLAKINDQLRTISKSSNQTSEAIRGITRSIAVLVTSGLSISYLTGIANRFANMSNQVALVTGRTEALVETNKKLLEISEATRGSLEGSVAVFSTFGKSLNSNVASMTQLLKATEAVQKSIAISGSSVDSARAAIIQLGQGLASNALRGEELNSVLEQTPRLARAIADGMGVNIGQLRLMAAEGKLTSDRVFKALLTQTDALNKEFKQLTPTLAQGMMLGNQSLQQYLNNLDKGLGVSTAISGIFVKVSKALASAAGNAEALGAHIRKTVALLLPMFGLIRELGKQFLGLIPVGFFTRTLNRSINTLFRSLDQQLFGGLSAFGGKFRHWWLFNLFNIESDLEKSIRNLKRINLFGSILDGNSLQLYSLALSRVLVAMRANTDNWWVSMRERFFGINFLIQDMLRYVGLLENTHISFKILNGQAFLATLGEISRGVLGLKRTLSSIGVLLWEAIGPMTVKLQSVLHDAARAIFRFVTDIPRVIAVIDAFLKGVLSVLRAIRRISLDMRGETASTTRFIDKYIYKTTLFKAVGRDLRNAADDISEGFSSLKRTFTNSEYVGNFFEKLTKVIEQTSGAFQKFKEILSTVWTVFTAERVLGILNPMYSASVKFWISVRESAVAGLQGAFAAVKRFAAGVIEAFYQIWDAVIGHSWWTDTINTVHRTSNELVGKTAGGLSRFKDQVISTFEAISKHRINLNGGLDKASELSDKFSLIEAIKAKLLATSSVFSNVLPSISRMITLSASLLLIQKIFPKGIIKKVLIGAIIASMAISSTYIGEALLNAVNDVSFIYRFGKRLGTSIGRFVAEGIREIPQLINAVLGGVSGFINGFLSKMPLIGPLIRKAFDFADMLGLAGPAGILAVYLFGKNLASIKSIFSFSEISTNVKMLFGIIPPTGTGVIAKFLFGTFGSVRLLSAIGLVLNSLGAFNSIFAGSGFTKGIAGGGLIVAMLLGNKGIGAITDSVLNGLILPIISKIKLALVGLIAKSGIAQSLTSGIFNGSMLGSAAKGAEIFLTTLLRKVSERVISASNTYGGVAVSFLDALLFGKDPKATRNKLIKEFTIIKNLVFEFLKKIATKIGAMKLFDNLGGSKFADSFKKANARRYSYAGGLDFEQVPFGPKAAAAAINIPPLDFGPQLDKVRARATEIGGKDGLVGRMLYGRTGKIAIGIALFSLLTLLSGKASASENSDNSGSFLKDNWTTILASVASLVLAWGAASFAISHYATLAKLAGIATKSVGIAAYGLQRGVEGAAAGATGLYGIASRGVRATKNVTGSVFQATKGYRTGIAGAAAGAAYSASGGGSVGEIAMTAIMSGILLSSFKGALSKIFFFLAKNPFVLAMVAAGGIFYYMFFGRGDSIGQRLKNLFSDIGIQIGMVQDKAAKTADILARKVSKRDSVFMQKNEIENIPNFSGVNFSALSSAQKEGITKAADDYAAAISRAKDSFWSTGEVAKDIKDELKQKHEELVKRRDTAVGVGNEKSVADSLRGFTEGRERESGKITSSIGTSIRQVWLNLSFSARELAGLAAIKLYPKSALSNPSSVVYDIADELKDLRSKRKTEYNAKWAPSLDIEKKIASILASVGVTGDKPFDAIQFTGSRTKTSEPLKKRLSNAAFHLQKIRDDRAWDTSDKLFKAREDAALAAYLHIAEQIRDALVDEKLITDFQKQTDDLVAAAKDAGLSMSRDSLFSIMSSPISANFKSRIELLKTLKESLKDTKSTADANEIVIKIATRTRELEADVLYGERRSTLNTLSHANILAGEVGINGMDLAGKNISDNKRKNLIDRMQALKLAQTSADSISPALWKLRAIGHGTTDNTRDPKVFQGWIDAFAKSLQRDVTAATKHADYLDKLPQQELKPGYQASLLGAFKRKAELEGQLPRATNAEKYGLTASIQKLDRDIALLTEQGTVFKAPFTEVLDKLPGFTAEQVLSLPPEVYSAAQQATVDIKRADTVLGNPARSAEVPEAQATKKAAIATLKLINGIEAGLITDLEKLGVNFDKTAIFGASTAIKEKLAENIALAIASQKVLFGPATQEAKAAADATLRLLLKRIELQLPIAAENTQWAIAGRNFGQTVQSDFAQALKDGLTGKSSFSMINIMQKLGDDLVGNFVDGLVNAMFAKGSLLKTVTEKVGGNAYASGSIAGDTLGFGDERISSEIQQWYAAVRDNTAALRSSTAVQPAYTTSSLPSFKSESSATSPEIKATDFKLPSLPDVFSGGASKSSAGIPDSALLGKSVISTTIGKAVDDKLKSKGDTAQDTLKDKVKESLASVKASLAKAKDSVNKFLKDSFGASGSEMLSAVGEGAAYGAALFSIFGQKDYESTQPTSAGTIALNRASGGWISGPGTETSDSIPLMASKNEFIVNAAAARKNAGLLSAINSGRLSAFATGGLIGGMPSLASIPVSTTASHSTSVFNLNITGDVSNQTRAEIQRMIPNIASGVNMHNKEFGFRR